MNNTVKNYKAKGWTSFLIIGMLLGLILGFVSRIGYHAFLAREYFKDAYEQVDKKLKADKQVLIDDSDIKVTFIGFNKDDNTIGNSITLLIDNKSFDPITVYGTKLEINGYTFAPVLSENYSPKEEKKVGIHYNDSLSKMNITKIAEAEFGLRIYNENSNSYKEYGPFNIKSNYFGEYDQEAEMKKIEKNVLFDDDKSVTISIFPSLTSDTGFSLNNYLEIINHSQHFARVVTQDIIINGYSNDAAGFYPVIIDTNEKTISELILIYSEAKINSGDEIESMEIYFDVNFYDSEGNPVDEVKNLHMKIK